MRLLTILFTLLLSASAIAQEEKITVLGFWAGMPETEFNTNCITRSYYCMESSGRLFNKPLDSGELLTTPMANYYYQNDSTFIYIPCGLTSTCGIKSISDLSMMLIVAGIVDYCENQGQDTNCYKEANSREYVQLYASPPDSKLWIILIGSINPSFD